MDTDDTSDTFKILREKYFVPRIHYTAELSFQYEGKIKTFPILSKERHFLPSEKITWGYSLGKKKKQLKRKIENPEAVEAKSSMISDCRMALV